MVDDRREHARLVGDARLDLHLAATGAGFDVADLRRLGVVGAGAERESEGCERCQDAGAHRWEIIAEHRQINARRPSAIYAAAVAPCGESLTETILEMPGSSMVTP